MTKKKVGLIVITVSIIAVCILVVLYNLVWKADNKEGNGVNTTKSEVEEQEAGMSSAEIQMYEYGKNLKNKNNVLLNQDKESNIIKEESIDSYVESMTKSGSTEDPDELKKNKSEEAIANRATYLAAKEAGFSISDEEIEKDINNTKQTMKGTDSEKLATAFCKGAGITEDEYWESVKSDYKISIIVSMYNEDCRNKIMDEIGKNPDQYSSDESEKQNIINSKMQEIVDSNIKKYNVHVE